MSQENVEIVRRSLEAVARGDVEEVLSLYAPEIEFLPLTGTRVESGGYRGHRGVRDYFAEAYEVWDEVRPEPEAMHAVGDDVIVFGHCAIRGKASKIETREPLAWVITVRDRKIVRHQVFRTTQEALEAVGLSE
jgi:ketosteroid isomerase-like protein